jgi:hypothetical protein
MPLTATAQTLITLLALLLPTGAALAQQLDDEPCRNALYHIEDAVTNPDYYARFAARATGDVVCNVENGRRTCMSGPENARIFANFIRSNGVQRLFLSRFALVPEALGETRYACLPQGNDRYELGIAIERHIVFANRSTVQTDLMLYTVDVEPGGQVYLVDSIRHAMANDRSDIWGRQQFVFDRRNGSSRTWFAATPVGGRPVNGLASLYPHGYPSSGSSTGSSTGPSGSGFAGSASGGGSQVITITRSGTSGMASSSSSASSQARRSAEGAARTACQNQGGRVLGIRSRPQGAASRVTDTTYRASYSATARCRIGG